MAERASWPLGGLKRRRVDRLALPNVPRQQLVLYLPVQRFQLCEIQYQDESTEQRALLVESDHRRIRLWICIRYQERETVNAGEARLGCTFHAYGGDLGWWVCVAEGVHKGRNEHEDLRQGRLDNTWICGANVSLHVLRLLRWYVLPRLSPEMPNTDALIEAAWQTCIYWFMGALTNNGRKLANFAGFYKGIQSAGAAIIYRIDALGAPYMNEFASSWGLLAGSLLIASPLIFMKIPDTVPIDADLVFTDETYEDVRPVILESAPGVQHEKA
jgi:hypothetical protein